MGTRVSGISLPLKSDWRKSVQNNNFLSSKSGAVKCHRICRVLSLHLSVYFLINNRKFMGTFRVPIQARSIAKIHFIWVKIFWIGFTVLTDWGGCISSQSELILHLNIFLTWENAIAFMTYQVLVFLSKAVHLRKTEKEFSFWKECPMFFKSLKIHLCSIAKLIKQPLRYY